MGCLGVVVGLVYIGILLTPQVSSRWLQASSNLRLLKPNSDKKVSSQNDYNSYLNQSSLARERFGLDDEDYAWVKKSMTLYRKEVARRHGFNLTDSDIASMPLLIDDMVPSVEQLEEILKRLKMKVPSRKKRHIVSNPTLRWTLPIKYVIDSAFTAAEMDIISGAINEWKTKTCITFEQHQPSETIAGQYVKFTRASTGCWAYVGMVSNPVPTIVNLQSPSCFYLWGLVIHEIGHIIGLYHEHSRPDRDDYVVIYPNNIITADLPQFTKDTLANGQLYNVPYDVGSIMHYGTQAFSTAANLYSILPRDLSVMQTLGQRAEVSFYDAKIVNLAYCSGMCSNQLACTNGGYTDPIKCNQCRCPDGYGGTLCDQIAQGSIGCSPLSSTLTVSTTSAQCLESPNYSSSSSSHGPFAAGSSCSWSLQSTCSTCKIKMWFDSNIGLLQGNDGSCQNWAEIRYKQSHVTRGRRVCGNGISPINSANPLVSDSNTASITFRAPQIMSVDTINSLNMVGFRLCYALESAPTTSYTFTVVLKLGALNWSDNLTDSSSQTYISTAQQVCLEMDRIYSSNSTVGPYNLCNAVKFSKGSVIASVGLSFFLASSSDLVVAANSIRKVLIQKLSASNLQIDTTSLVVKTDPSCTISCSQICYADSGSFKCACYDGYQLNSDQITCSVLTTTTTTTASTVATVATVPTTTGSSNNDLTNIIVPATVVPAGVIIIIIFYLVMRAKTKAPDLYERDAQRSPYYRGRSSQYSQNSYSQNNGVYSVYNNGSDYYNYPNTRYPYSRRDRFFPSSSRDDYRYPRGSVDRYSDRYPPY